MFSKLAFGALSNFFLTLKKLHFVPPNTWNPGKQKLEMDPNPNKIRWIFSNLIVLLTWIILQIYTLSVKSDTLNSAKIIFLTLELFIGIHSVPLFLKACTDGEELSAAMNSYIKVEKYLRGDIIFNRSKCNTPDHDGFGFGILEWSSYKSTKIYNLQINKYKIILGIIS